MTRPSLDDPSIRAWRDQTLYRLLLRASRTETTATLDRIREIGYLDVSLADTNLLANLDTGGTIISALARRAGITRQAAGPVPAGLDFLATRAIRLYSTASSHSSSPRPPRGSRGGR